MKEKGKKKTERKDKIDKDEKYEKQGIGEQGEGEKLRKKREKIRGQSFSNADPKGRPWTNQHKREIWQDESKKWWKNVRKKDESLKKWKTRGGFFFKKKTTKWTKWKIHKGEKQKSRKKKRMFFFFKTNGK